MDSFSYCCIKNISRRGERTPGDELDPSYHCFIKKLDTRGERMTEMSWIHFLVVLLRKSIQEAGEGERGGQQMSWIHFLIVLLRKSTQEKRGGRR